MRKQLALALALAAALIVIFWFSSPAHGQATQPTIESVKAQLAEASATVTSLTSESAALAAARDALTAKIAEVDAAITKLAAERAAANQELGATDERLAATKAALAEAVARKAALEKLLAELEAAAPKPLPFADAARFGWNPGGDDPAAVLANVLGADANTWLPRTVALKLGKQGGGKLLEWRAARDGLPYAYGVVQGLGRDFSIYDGPVKTNSYWKQTNAPAGDGNEGFCNSLYDATFGDVSLLGNNKSTIARCSVGNLNLARNWTAPLLVTKTIVRGTVKTGSYHSPPVISLSDLRGAITNDKNGLILDRCLGTVTVTNTTSPGIVALLDSPGLKYVNTAGHFYRRNGATESASRNLSPTVPSLILKPLPDFPEFDYVGLTSVKDFGAVPGDGKDDMPAVQRAIDAGKLALFFPRGTYETASGVDTRGKVVRAFGCDSRFKSIGGSAAVWNVAGGSLFLDRFNHKGGDGGGQLFMRQSGGVVTIRDTRIDSRPNAYVGTGGTLHLQNVFTRGPHWRFGKGQKVYGVQLNPETEGDATAKIVNDGATLHLVGTKFEGKGVYVHTLNGGLTQLDAGFGWVSSGTWSTEYAPFECSSGGRITVNGFYFGGSGTGPEIPPKVVTVDGVTRLAKSACPQGPGARLFVPHHTTN